MSPFELFSAIAFFVTAIACLCVACYGLGRNHGSPVYTINGGLPQATDWGQVAQVQAIELTAEVVGYLEPAVVLILDNPFTTMPELTPAPDPLVLVAAQSAVDVHDELVAQVAQLQRTKRTALTRARIATAQVAGLVDAVLRPRRPSRAALVAATIEVDSVERPLVPAPIAKKLEEAS